jgi:polysaccharide biosynthesis/export protein
MPRRRPQWRMRNLAPRIGCLGVALLAFVTASAGAQATHPNDYEIGPGDVLKVVVIGQAQMTGDFPVDPEGMVSFPILGKIKGAQHTTLELERKITTLLSDGILRRPQVTVSVSEYGSQRVFVTGEVQRPGRYPLKADRTLLTLLGDIGALGPNVGHEVIVIRPPDLTATTSRSIAPTTTAGSTSMADPAAPVTTSTGGSVPTSGTDEASAAAIVPGLPFVAGSEVIHISLLELQSGNPEKNVTLKAGDTAYFPKASQVYVMGSVARPGPIRYQEGMTVMQALTLAGGATDRGSAGRTKVIRIVDGKKVERKVKATDLVLPEDTLMVPERFF